MPSGLSPTNENYLYGKGRLYFKPDGETGFIDFGNVPKFEITVAVEKAEHYSSRYGSKEKDLEFVTQKKADSSFDLEEYSAENLNLAFLGDGVQTAAQTAGQIDALSVVLAPDRFIDIGASAKYALTYRKISHGAVTGNTFAVGETVTGAPSAKTGKIARVGNGFIEVIHDTGIQIGDTITGGTSSAAAEVTGIETMSGAVVMPASQLGTRTAVGTPAGTNLPTLAGCFWDDAPIEFRAKITTAGTPDKFKYSLDGGLSWSGELNCSTDPVYCAKGISVDWSATTGGVLNDEWKWAVASRYQPGTDHDVDAMGGMIRKRSTGVIGASAVVSADYPVKALRSVRALVNSEVQGALRFIGDPDRGPKLRVDGWKVLLTINGAAAFIGDDIQAISMSASFQSDRTNHPTEPFFRATEIA